MSSMYFKKGNLRLSLGLFLALTCIFSVSPVSLRGAEAGIDVSVIDSAGDPVGEAAVFLDQAYVGSTSEKGVKEIKVVDPGRHLVVVKKKDLGRTSANLYLSEKGELQLRLKIAPDTASPCLAQFGFHPEKPEAGSEITLRGFTPMGIDSSELNYRWDTGGDGMIDAEGMEVTPTVSSSGDFPVTLTVTRNGEVVSKHTREIVVSRINVPPKASFATSSDVIAVATPVSLDGSASKDRNGKIVEYRWRIDGKAAGGGETVHHTFEEPGPHDVTLVVTDEEGVESKATKTLSVAPKTYVSRLFYREGQGMDWVTSSKVSKNDPLKMINSDKKRRLELFFERKNKEVEEIVHQLKPTSPGVIEVIGQVVVDPEQETVKLKGKGYTQIGKITYDFKENIRRRVVKDWNGNTMFTKENKLKQIGGADRTQHSFTLNFLTRASLESVALDVLAGKNSEPLIVATTELFNYRKLTAVKTSLQSGVDPSKYNLAPHLMAYPPEVIYATEGVEFDFISFDADGPLGKMVVGWGDGKKTKIKEPVSGRNEVDHTYEKPGKYEVNVTSYDTSGRENNFKKLSFMVEVKKRSEYEPKKDECHHHGELQLPQCSYSLAL